VLIGAGIVLVSLSAGELALREHFAGYRSHTSLLAGIVAILLAVGVAVFAGAFAGLRALFRRRAGGVAFRA
jgi:hypothetical protein